MSAFLCSCNKGKTAKEAEHVDTIPMMVLQIQKCSRLYTTEYNVHKIITHNDKVNLKGTFLNKEYDIDLPFSERKIAIPIDATIKAYIDFYNFSENNVDRNGKKINITLPDPHIEITSTTIDHDAIKEHVSFMRSDFTDEELTRYEQQGRSAILAEIPKMGITDRAMESAARVLVPLIRQMGFDEKDITITFRKDFTVADYNSIIKKSDIER